MSSRIIKHIYQQSVYITGITVLLAAITVTIIRLALPDIGMYRNEVEAWVSNYTDLPVIIHSIEAEWAGWVPHLYLKDIELLNHTGTDTLVQFNSAEISINPLASLLNRRIIPIQLTVSGFNLSVARRENGSVFVQGFDIRNYSRDSNSDNDFARWLFNQNSIELRKGQIEWIDEQLGQEPVSMTDVSLFLRTDKHRLQFEGSASLSAPYGERIEFAFDSSGDLLTSDWSAGLYVHGDNLDPGSWYRKYRPEDELLSGGNASVSLWGTLVNAKFTSLDGRIVYTDFNVLQGEDSLSVDNLGMQFSCRKLTEDNWEALVHLDKLITENGPWPGADFRVLLETDQFSREQSVKAEFSYVNFADLMPFLDHLQLLPAAVIDFSERYAPRGHLVDGQLAYNLDANDTKRLVYNVRLNNFSTRADTGVISLQNISGRVTGSLAGGSIIFDHDSAEIISPSIDRDQLRLHDINGTVMWSINNNSGLLSTELLEADTGDFSVKLSGSVLLSGNAPPFVDAMVSINAADLEDIISYIPATPVFKARNWMQRSLLGGRLLSANAILRGNLQDFPFDNHDGQFRIIADLSDTVLEYSPLWPVVDNIEASAVFHGRGLTVKAQHGQIFNSTVKTTTVSVPDIFNPAKTVYVDGQVLGTIDDLTRFILNSPLSNDLMLRKVSESISGGQMDLGLGLSIPINNPDSRLAITGKLDIDGATVASDLEDLKLNDVQGSGTFDQDSITAERLTARFENRDVTLSVTGSKNDDDNPAMVTISGNGDEDFLREQLGSYFPKLADMNNTLPEIVSGETHWQASLTYKKSPGDSRLNRTLRISSDLDGLAVNLPAPLGKETSDPVMFSIIKELDIADRQQLRLEYGEILAADLTFDPANDNRLLNADIILGTDTGIRTEHDGISVSGRIDHLDVNAWQEFLGKNNSEAGENVLPVTASLSIGELVYSGQWFNDISVSAIRNQDDWHVDMSGDSIAGTLTLPRKPDRNSVIQADLTILKLQKIEAGDTTGDAANPALLPSITARVESFGYADKDLGTLDLVARSNENGLSIEKISLTKPEFNILATGNWVGNELAGNSSEFIIQVEAEKFNNILETFGYATNAIEKGETSLSIHANWTGTPMDFSLDRLNGSLGMHISRGQLLDVKSSAGRLFGLLSIQTLPRRLSMDFSDLFGKGLAFDTIDGNFTIENGNAYTNDLEMKGPSINVNISGRTGLSEQDYDQRATVTPQLTDSLPVTGAFFGPVGIGLGAILYLAGNLFDSLQNNINRLMMFEYTITGSWDNPVIEKYKLNQGNNG